MTQPKKLFILRKDIPHIGKVIGDVIEILPAQQTGGSRVDVEGGIWTIVTVTDLSQNIEDALMAGFLRLRNPSKDDPMFQALLPKGDGKAGHLTTTEEILMEYIEVVDA